MKNKKLFLLVLAGFVFGAAGAASAEGEAAATTAPAKVDTTNTSDADEIWTNTIWTDIDDMVKKENYERQKIITVAGARGTEATNPILAKLYYRGAKRYPSQEKLFGAIEKLKQSISANPKDSRVPKMKYYIAQCREKLGQKGEAQNQYNALVAEHPETLWATKAKKRLAQL